MLYLSIPKQVKIEIGNSWILIKGPLGEKKKRKANNIRLVFDENTSKLWLLNSNSKENHFYLIILKKVILGVWKGFSKKLNIIGVGYKANIEQNKLNLKIGFCHSVVYTIPKNISIKVLNQKMLTLLIFGNNFQQVTQVAAEIRQLRPAEPYKGKGIKYFGETIRRKEGKKTNV